MKTLEDFVRKYYPNLLDQYVIYNMPIEELIGKDVISITSGFNIPYGQHMTIDSIIGDKSNGLIYLIPNERSIITSNGHRGWQCRIEEIPLKIKLYTN